MQWSAAVTLAGQAAVVFCTVFLIAWAPLKMLEKMFDSILADQRERDTHHPQTSDHDWTTLEDHPPPGIARETKRVDSRRASKGSDANSAGPSRTASFGDSDDRSELLNRRSRWSRSPVRIGNAQSKGIKTSTSPEQTPGARSGPSKTSSFQSLQSLQSISSHESSTGVETKNRQKLLERTPSRPKLKHSCSFQPLLSKPSSQESSAGIKRMNGRMFEKTPSGERETGPKVERISSGTRFLARTLTAESLTMVSAISSLNREKQNVAEVKPVPLLRASKSASAFLPTPGTTHFSKWG